MALLQEWRDIAYSQETDRKQLQKFWSEYFLTEKGIYEQLLENPEEAVTGTVKELAEKYNIPVLTMTGFLDGINDSLKKPRSECPHPMRRSCNLKQNACLSGYSRIRC